MKADDAKKLKELGNENQRRKRIVADQALNIDMLKELTGKAGSSASPAPLSGSHHPFPPTTGWQSGPSSKTCREAVIAGVGDTGQRPLRQRLGVHRLRRGRLVPVQRYRHRLH